MANLTREFLKNEHSSKSIDDSQLRERIIQEITPQSINVSLESVLGLKVAKTQINKALKPPFDNLGTSPILLYGNAKIGKKTLVMAAAKDANYTLLHVRPETVQSPWNGESLKILSIIFDHAKKNSPSVVLLQDIETTLSKKSCTNRSTIASHLFFEMDKIRREQFRVMLIGTTDRALELDTVLSNRFRKVLAVAPNKFERKEILEIILRDIPNTLSPQEINNLANRTRNYPVSDLKSLAETEALKKAKTHGQFCKLMHWIKAH